MTAGTAPAGLYRLCGVVDAKAALPAHASSIVDSLDVIRHDSVAALVCGPYDQPPRISRAALHAHARLLDTVAVATPVLPGKFSVTLAPRDHFTAMLAGNEASLHAALVRLRGCTQLTVKVRHVREAVLTEVLDERPEAARLRDVVDAAPANRTSAHRVRLGEIVATALANKHAGDAATLTRALAPHAVAVAPRPAGDPDKPFGAAFLVERDARSGFEATLENLAQSWRHRARIRVHGPTAAYDFVAAGCPAAGQPTFAPTEVA
jgi:hypothetical protein